MAKCSKQIFRTYAHTHKIHYICTQCIYFAIHGWEENENQNKNRKKKISHHKKKLRRNIQRNKIVAYIQMNKYTDTDTYITDTYAHALLHRHIFLFYNPFNWLENNKWIKKTFFIYVYTLITDCRRFPQCFLFISFHFQYFFQYKNFPHTTKINWQMIFFSRLLHNKIKILKQNALINRNENKNIYTYDDTRLQYQIFCICHFLWDKHSRGIEFFSLKIQFNIFFCIFFWFIWIK